MKITALERIRRCSVPNFLWVHMYTDEGLKSLGEVHFGPGPVDTHIHDWPAQKLIGRDPVQVEAAQDALAFYLGSTVSGAVRNAILVYSTCASSNYLRETRGIRPSSFAHNSGKCFDDIDVFLSRADLHRCKSYGT